MAIPAVYNSPATASGYQNPIREASSKTTWKTHALVVLSYFLIGIGIALACASVYIATMVHPMIAMASPIVPIALGILLRPDQAPGLFSTTRSLVYIPGQPLGIVNPNENCWLNSALQMLFHTPAYQALMRDLSRESILPSSVQRLLPFQSLFQLFRAFKNYHAELAEESGQPTSSLSSASVRRWLSNVKEEVPAEGTQHDPMALFEELHTRSGQFLPLMQQKNDEAPLSRNEFFIPLAMQSGGSNAFTELFNGFFFEYIPDSETVLQKWFTQAPRGFLIGARRFYRHLDGSQSKISDLLDFPMQLELTEEQCREGARTFTPDTFIVHHGKTDKSGHYTAFVRRNGHWWHVNDSYITQVTDREAKESLKQAYMVHYAQAAAATG